MRDLKIVFMGTPEFAVESLKAIVTAGYNVVGVITAPDRPAGRGRKLQQSAVKTFAIEHDLKVLQPNNLKSDDFLSELRSLDGNLQVVVAFRMLPEVVWNLPPYGTFNLHASLLPQYRGAAPINWAVINGETRTGVSTFFIDEKIDTGKMIFQESTPIDPAESAGNLHDKLMHLGSGLVVKTINAIAQDRIQTTSQKEARELKPAPKLNRENTRINWSRSLDEIYNLVRGLSPNPAAWTELINGNNQTTLKIFETTKLEAEHQLEPGKIVQDGNTVKIAVKGGFLELKEIQVPGKRKMTIKDLLNGFDFFPNAKVR